MTTHTMNRAQRRQPAKRQRQADHGSIYRIMNKLQLFTPDELSKLKAPVRMAFERLRTGSGDECDFHTLAAVVNVSLIRSESIAPECVEVCQAAQKALLAIVNRHERWGKWELYGEEGQDLLPAIELHEQLLELSSPLQMADAMKETIKRMNDGHAFPIEKPKESKQ